MEFFGKLAFALGVWAIICLLTGVFLRPFSHYNDEKTIRERLLSTIWLMSALACGLGSTFIAIFS